MLRKFSVFGAIFVGLFCLGCEILGDVVDSVIMDYKAELFLEQTGVNPQSLVIDDDKLFLLNSGDNKIWRVSLDGKKVDKDFVELGSGSGALYISKGDDYLFVSNYEAGSIDVVKKSDGKIISSSKKEIDNPVQTMYINGKLFVAVSEYKLNGSQEKFGALQVYNFENQELRLSERLESSCNHTVGLVYWKGADKVISISTGRSGEDSCIDIYDEKSLKLSKSIILGKGAGESGVIIEDTLYIGGTNGKLFIVNLNSGEVSTEDISSKFGLLSLCVFNKDKILVSPYKEDSLYLYSSAVNTHLTLEGGSNFGPMACVDSSNGSYVIMNSARMLYKVGH